MGRKSKKEGIHVYTQVIHFTVFTEINFTEAHTTLESNYTPIKIGKKKKKSISPGHRDQLYGIYLPTNRQFPK